MSYLVIHNGREVEPAYSELVHAQERAEDVLAERGGTVIIAKPVLRVTEMPRQFRVETLE